MPRTRHTNIKLVLCRLKPFRFIHISETGQMTEKYRHHNTNVVIGETRINDICVSYHDAVVLLLMETKKIL